MYFREQRYNKRIDWRAICPKNLMYGSHIDNKRTSESDKEKPPGTKNIKPTDNADKSSREITVFKNSPAHPLRHMSGLSRK